MGAGSGLRKTVSLPVAAAQEQAEKPFYKMCLCYKAHLFIFCGFAAPASGAGAQHWDAEG